MTERATEGLCAQCGEWYRFQAAKSLDVIAWWRYCSRTCESGRAGSTSA